jgi:hypothetical protein
MGLRRSGRDPLIIMDNSLIELGKPLPTNDLIKASLTVGARYLVLPDSLGDAYSTVDRTAQAYKQLAPAMPDGMQFMCVLQGNTLPRAAWCMNKFSEILGRDMGAIAVPRVMQKTFGSRMPPLQMVAKELGLPIHLLGFSNDLMDDIKCSRVPGVMGIDSAYPVWSGRSGPTEVVMHHPANYQPELKRPDDFWDFAHIGPAMIYNIMRFREWFKPQ